MGSSTMPSQSLSRPSQAAAVGPPGVALQTTPVWSDLQMFVPERWHTPTPAVHAWLLVGYGSSTVPLQSLSRLSQVSVEGPTVRTHTTAPVVHVWVPAEQTPSCPVVQ